MSCIWADSFHRRSGSSWRGLFSIMQILLTCYPHLNRRQFTDDVIEEGKFVEFNRYVIVFITKEFGHLLVLAFLIKLQQSSLFMINDDVTETTRAPINPWFHHKIYNIPIIVEIISCYSSTVLSWYWKRTRRNYVIVSGCTLCFSHWCSSPSRPSRTFYAYWKYYAFPA